MKNKIAIIGILSLGIFAAGCSQKNTCENKYNYIMNIKTKSHEFSQENNITCCINEQLKNDPLCIPKERDIITPPPYKPLYNHEYSQYTIKKIKD